MIVKKYDVDFVTEPWNNALTLNLHEVTDEDYPKPGSIKEKTHPDGWTIKGEVKEDYFWWVNSFEARHPDYGTVRGDFESEVFADSEEGFNHFYKNHKPVAWNYADI